MNGTLKRMAAIVMAAMMLLGSFSAFAEMPMMQVTDVYARGARIKSETTIDINQETVSGLLAMFGGAQDGAEMQNLLIDTVLGAIRKLNFVSLSDGADSFVSIGTEAGELLNVMVTNDEQSNEMVILTSLLPHIGLAMPVEALTSSVQTQDLDEVMNQLAPYGEVLTDFATTDLLGAAAAEEGSFEIADVGTFDSLVKGELKSHSLADLMDRLLAVFKEDADLQQTLDAAISTGANATQMEGVEVSSSQDMIKEIEEAIAEIRADENETLASLAMYTTNESEAVYAELELLDDGQAISLLSLAMAPTENGADVYLSILLSESEDETAVQGPVDWAAKRQGVLDGTSYTDVLIDIAISQNTNVAANRDEVKGGINIYLGGIQLGIGIDGGAALEGEYASDFVISFSVFSPDPLFTVTTKSYETQEEMPATTRDGYKMISLSGELSDEDNQALNEAIGTALPELIERLKVALPEEGQMLAAILESMMNPGTPSTN